MTTRPSKPPDSESPDAVRALVDALDRSLPGALPRAALEASVDLVARYARIEKLLHGGPQIAYSPSSLDAALTGPAREAHARAEKAERLAAAERKRLGVGPGPILELQELVEDQGIKVVACPFPPDSDVLGGFFFSDVMGPTALVHAHATPSERTYAMARNFGHFLADIDPYPTILWRHPGTAAFADPSELRAHLFALAFLMPPDEFTSYRDAFPAAREDPLVPQLLQHLQVYFELEPQVLLWRYLSLQWCDAARLERFLADHPDLAERLRQRNAAPADTLPDRFLHLVASAYGHDKLSLEDAARELGTSIDEARVLLGKFRYDDPDKRRQVTPPEPPPEDNVVRLRPAERDTRPSEPDEQP